MKIPFGFLDSVPRVTMEALLNSIWQGALLALFIWMLLRLFKRANATTKYSVWLATLLAVVCLPLVNALTSSRAPVSETLNVSSPPRFEIPTLSLTPLNTLQLPTIDSTELKKEAAPFTGSDTAAAASIKPSGIGINSGFEMSLEARPLEESYGIQLKGERWPLAFLFLWMVGATCFMLRLVRCYLSLRRLKLASQPLTENHRQRMKHWAEVCGIRRTVHLRGSKEITAPLMLGLKETVILFPERLAKDLTEDEFDQVLLHELAHVRRLDDWSNLLQKLVEALFFFHPAVLWMGRQLNAEREIACDQWVVSLTGAHRSYASCLTKLFELSKRRASPLLSPGAITIKSHLTRRIETILRDKRKVTPRFSTAGFLVPLCVLFVLLIQLGHVPPVIALSAPPNSVVEQAGAAPLTVATTDSQTQSADLNGRPADPLGEMSSSEGEHELQGSEAMTQMSTETASSEPLGLPEAHDETPARQQPSWLEMVGGPGNVSSGAVAQPVAFTTLTADEQQGIQSSQTQPLPATQAGLQETAPSSATPSANTGPLPPDFFKVVAAMGSAGSQRAILSELLKRPGLTEENLVQALVVAKNIDSDGEKAEFLVNAAAVTSSNAEVLNAFFNVVSSIDSAGERRRVLSALLKLKGGNQGVLLRILKAASAIDSEGERSELLVRAASLYKINGASLQAFLDAVSIMDSSGEQRRSLTALLRQGNLGSEAVIQILRCARRISSDGEKAALLLMAVEVCPMNDALFAAYMATASSIGSSGEQARVIFAISKKKASS